MKKYQINCPYCGSPALLRPGSTVHGDSAVAGRYLYVCSRWPACDSYVSAHKKDRRPMGTLANGSLRHKRILAHRAFEGYRKDHHMEKRAAYLWLQTRLGLDSSEAHIGMFSEQMCERVISLCRQPPIGCKSPRMAERRASA